MAAYQRNGAWWIDYYFRGQRFRQKIGSRKRDAEEALSRIKVQIAAGEFVPPEERPQQEATEPRTLLFSEFAEKEFMPWSETNHSPAHHRNQESQLRVHLLPHFGEKYLHEITPKYIDDFLTLRRKGHYVRGKTRRPVTNATVNRTLACIKLMFRKAVEWGLLADSPARKVKLLRETPKEPDLLEADQVERLLEEMPDHLKGLVACAVYAGLRRSELFHLQWRDVDWKAGELTVASRTEHPTKNYQSRRIPMNDELVEALRRHPRRLDSLYVFPNADGRPYDNIDRALNSAADRAGINGPVHMHQLRHAFCSHALMQGIDPRTVQKWMGHRDLSTTLRYAHVSPDHEKEAIQRLRYGHEYREAGNGSVAEG